MSTSEIDWSTLDFTCIREEQNLPKPDPEASAWYNEGLQWLNRGLEKDDDAALKQAATLFHKAAAKGHVKAMNNLASMYLRGEGVEQSDDKAVEWAEELIKRNIAAGYYHMGIFLDQGIGVKQDRKAALAYFRKSADLGDPQGQLAVADSITTAVGTADPTTKERGYSIARRMYQCALNQGLGDAGYEYGTHLLIAEKKPTEALTVFQQAAKLGHNSSLYYLQQIFENGEYGFEKDPTRAACYKRLWEESNNDKTKTFPNINRICPLPPKPNGT